MNLTTQQIGYASAVAATILTAVLPIFIQESEMDIFVLIFLFSIVSIVVSFIYMAIFEVNSIDTIKHLLLNATTNKRIFILGAAVFLLHWLMLEGVMNVDTGVYNVLLILEILIGIRLTLKEANTPFNLYEYAGFACTLAGISAVVFAEFLTLHTIGAKKTFAYGVLCLIAFVVLSIRTNFAYNKIVTNPFSTMFLQCIVMFAFALIALLVSKAINPTSYILTKFPQSLPSMLYVLTIPIFVVNFLPSIFEFAEYDYLSFPVIAVFLLIQTLIGFFLDTTYFHKPFTPVKMVACAMIIVGVSVVLYGNYLQTLKKTKTHTP